MDILPASRSIRLGRLHSALLTLTALGSGLMHLGLAIMFLLVVAMGDSPRAPSEPHVPPYTGMEFTVLVSMLALAGLVLLPVTYFAFVSLKATTILGSIATSLDLLFLFGESLANDDGETLLSAIAGEPKLLGVLVTWIGPPAFIAGSSYWSLRRAANAPVTSPAESVVMPIRPTAGLASTRPATSKRLVGAMLIGLLYAMTPLPFESGWANIALVVLAVGIPTFPHYAHWIVASFIVLAAMHVMLILVSGPADSFPAVMFSLILTLLMLRLVLRGQRNLGIHGHTEPGLGHG
jgi:hypothetical protein